MKFKGNDTIWIVTCAKHGYVFCAGSLQKHLESCSNSVCPHKGVFMFASGVAEGWTQLCDFTFTFHFHTLEKEMATHSSVLAWRIPGTAEPGGLPSMGSHRVGHNWSDLAAAAGYLWLLPVLWKQTFKIETEQQSRPGDVHTQVSSTLCIGNQYVRNPLSLYINIYVYMCGSGGLVTHLCPTLCDPKDSNLPGSSVLGISQARKLPVAISFPRGSFWPGIKPMSPALKVDSSPLSHNEVHLLICIFIAYILICIYIAKSWIWLSYWMTATRTNMCIIYICIYLYTHTHTYIHLLTN